MSVECVAERVPAGYKQTEVGLIPEDWEVKSIADCVSISVGRDLKEENYSTYQDDIFKYPVFSNTVAHKGLYGFYDIPEYSGESLTIVGRGVGLGTAFTRKGSFGAIGRLLVLFPEKNVNANFLTEYINNKVKVFTESAGIPQLTGISIAKYKIPIPPTLAEQEAIGQALTDVDAFIESLEQLIDKKRQIKQGALQNLLTGKCRLNGFSAKWKQVFLGDVSTFHKGKGLPKSELDPFGDESCIHYGELFTHYKETIYNVISRTNNIEDCVRSVSNDVLMPTSDVTPNGLAKASCVEIDGVILGGDILVIRSNTDYISGSFLSHVIRHDKDQVLQLVTGTTVFHLYASDMKRFTLLLPPLYEQQAIVNTLDMMDKEITTLEEKLTKTRKLKQGMMQELLTGRIRLI